MGRNGSYNQIHHHRNLSTSSSTTTTTSSTSTTTSFLPLLCRISTKDVAEISPCNKKNDPSSPKVSCMGQIKRHNHNNKINPTCTTTGKVKYTQLKKLFSGRNLLITTNASASTITCTRNSTYCKGNKKLTDKRKGGGEYHRRTRSDNCGVVVPLNLAELDPPLPVVKLTCRRRGDEEGESLWKRRGGGTPLGGLQIQHFQLPTTNSCLLITPPSVS